MKFQKKLEVIQQISNKNNLSSIKNKYDKSNINYKFIEFTNDSNELYNGIDLAITEVAQVLSELSPKYSFHFNTSHICKRWSSIL